MKRSKLLFLLLCLAGALAFNPKAYGQKVALKSNLAHWALMGSPNAGVEFACLDRFKDHRYEGTFYGAGISVGHQFVLSPLMNIELSVGGGWARIDYRKFDCATCGRQISDGKYDYFGVTRATLSLLFFLK